MSDFFDDNSSPSGSSEPLKGARLVVDEHEIFISVDKNTLNKIFFEILRDKHFGTFPDPSMLKYFENYEKLLGDRKKGRAEEIFKKLAVMPAGLGMIAAVAANLLSSPHGLLLSRQIAEILPACLALAVSLGNLIVLYYRIRD